MFTNDSKAVGVRPDAVLVAVGEEIVWKVGPRAPHGRVLVPGDVGQLARRAATGRLLRKAEVGYLRFEVTAKDDVGA